jgi:hypothetical protein
MGAEGDRAAFELRFSGIQNGPMSGPERPMLPTNRRIEMTYAIFIRVNSRGLTQEQREYYNARTFDQQLGLAP